MATYTFSTITPAEALAITAADAVLFGNVAANQVTVIYNPAGTVTVTAAGRTVEFGSAFATLGANGRTPLSTDARLFVGDNGANASPAPNGVVLSDGLYGGGGEDTLDGGLGDDLLQGNQGADYLLGGGGRDVIYGGQDNDRIVTTVEALDGVTLPANDGGDFAQGNRGDDVIVGGPGADTLLGGQGNDSISSLAGGTDILNGNLGDDRIEGAGTLLGEGGADTLIGTGAADSLFGGDGDDRITMAQGQADGGLGADRIEVRLGAGEAVVLGGDGADTLQAQLASRALNVRFSGGEGQDSLQGSGGVDTLAGDAGGDTIDGLGGRDRVTGGEGQDQFQIRSYAQDSDGAPADPISVLDWETGDRLKFAFEGFTFGSALNYREITAGSYAASFDAAKAAVAAAQGSQYVAVQVGADVVVFGFGGGSDPASVILVGRGLADIAFDNFV
ncbi:calcium-binding protein [Phenylobacterium sp.]|uniref:calcium-binding protein n=1 Tax=Phenylobacterium sp. TaxID=1871053 RepID=UPI003D29E84E